MPEWLPEAVGLVGGTLGLIAFVLTFGARPRRHSGGRTLPSASPRRRRRERLRPDPPQPPPSRRYPDEGPSRPGDGIDITGEVFIPPEFRRPPPTVDGGGGVPHPARDDAPMPGARPVDVPPPPPPPPLAPEPEPPVDRFANVVLRDPATGTAADLEGPLAPASRLDLLLSIGALDPSSVVTNPTPLPQPPTEDVTLDVVVSSTTVGVATAFRGRTASTATGTFTLPADGSAARTPTGATEMRFTLLLPTEVGAFRVRISYVFRDAIVQSQRIDGSVGVGGGVEVVTDFTATADIWSVPDVSVRPRLAILGNDSSGSHTITVRAPSITGGETAAVGLSHEQLQEPLTRLRSAISNEDFRPSTRRRSRDQLTGDLRRLAGPGAALFHRLFADARDVVESVRDLDDAVVQVAKPTGSSFTIPWTYIYEFPLTQRDPEAIARLPVCATVSDWDGNGPLVGPGQRRCRYEAEPGYHRDRLCPFGFWGFRRRLEILTNADSAVKQIEVSPGAPFVGLVSDRGLDREQVLAHVEKVRDLAAPGGLLSIAEDVVAAEAALRSDVPLVYMLCHGERHGAETWLSLTRGPHLRPDLFEAWVNDWSLAGARYWYRVRPLVFINACQSVDVRPETMVGYVEAFVGAGRAAGVIGTEAAVHAELAMAFASSFFTHVARQSSVGDALHAARVEFLADGNLFGLLYAPFCWSDLQLVAAT